MNNIHLHIKPVAKSKVFWKHKPAFELSQDSYPEWVLFAVVEGSFAFRIEESSGEASFGDLVLCPPHVPFFRKVIEPLSFHFYRFDWQISDTQDVTPPPGGKISIRDHARLSSTYYYLKHASNITTESAQLTVADHMLRDLWHLYCMEANLHADHFKVEPDVVMKAALRLLREKAFSRVNIQHIATSVGLSPVQFTRRFYACYGQKPIAYLISIRINEAKRLLLETSMSLDQIAEHCGYESGFYLSRIFKKNTGIPPASFRNFNRI
jgi:AraC family transcriptional regulator